MPQLVGGAVLPDLSRFDRVSIDTETTGLGYRDRPVGLSWATPDGTSGYLAWGHGDHAHSLFDTSGAGNNIGLDEVREWARRELRPDLLVVMHNAPFDLRQLAYVGIAVPQVEDTMVCAPILNELEPAFSLDALSRKYTGRHKSDQELNEWCAMTFGGRPTRRDQAKNYWRAPVHIMAPYAIGDTELTLSLYDTLRPRITSEGLDEIYALETAILPMVVEMHMTGVRVDLDAAHALDAQLTLRIDAALARWNTLAPGVDPAKKGPVVDVFRRAGLAVSVTAKGNPSILSEDLAHMPHPIAQTLLEWRQLTHHRDVYVRAYILGNADATGLLHPEFHALRSDDFGSVAGRFSSGSSDGSLNLQNIPARDEEWAPIIRGLFVPYHKDWRWLKGDYSQIQFRFLAHYAALLGHPALAQAYRDNPGTDFHQLCADLTGIPRKPAKNINFGIVFGMGKDKLARSLGLEDAKATAILAEYHRKLPAVRATSDALTMRANARGVIRTWGGRLRRFIPAADAKARGWRTRDSERFVGCHKGLNALLQGSEGDLMKRAMVALRPILRSAGVPLHLTVHDELDMSVPPGAEGLRIAGQVREAMEDYRLEVPVLAEMAIGPNWGDTEKIKEPLCLAA